MKSGRLLCRKVQKCILRHFYRLKEEDKTGGRGASGGISAKGKPYGSEYTTLYQNGNIKFVRPNVGATTAPMETMTRGRVYVTIDSNHDPKFISYYDTTNKRFKQIDLDRPHKGVLPHTHHGYEHNENDSTKGYAYLTTEEKKMVEGIKKIWYDWYNKP